VLGQIINLIPQAGSAAPQAYGFGYDSVNQLKSGVLKDASQAILKSYTYDYDGAAKRTLEAIDSLVTGDTVNNLNQLTTRQGGAGVMPIRGTTNEPSTVTVNGSPAAVKADNGFEGKAAVTTGNNTVTVVAADVNGNAATNRYNLVVTGSGSKTLVYDANGNLTGDGTRTFEWDPLNRLTAVTSGTHRTEFTCNGLSQRVKIVEKDNGSVTSTKQFVWIPRDTQPSEERDASNTVTKRFYAQGVQIGSTNYYYTRDHLGSVRELTDSSGAVQARYDYDPYGRRTKVSGSVDADFGFTGHYYHQPSALHLALYRAYDADLGRWISRDPIAEQGGINLYRYVSNNPINIWDPLGLDGYTQTGPLSIDTDTTTKTTPVDPSHQNQLAPGSPGNNGPGVVAPPEAKGVKMGDPATLTTNGQTVQCVVFDSSGPGHKNKPEVNEAAAKAAGLQVKSGPQGPYPSAGPGDAAVPASIYFPTAK